MTGAIRFTVLALAAAAAPITPQCDSSAPSSASTANTLQVVVNAGPANNYFNGAFASVTICVPGTSNCQTVDGVLVDTGSSGLRVLSSALSLNLSQQTDSNGSPVVECAQFLDGFTWGPVQSADVKMAGEVASNTPIQVIGAPSFSNIPAACSATGAAEDTLTDLGVNGILGISVFKQDCGLACSLTGASNPGFYYSCPSSGCTVLAEATNKQLQNPVSLFASDNNGVVLQMPTVALGGVSSVTGTMTFGIGTQSDNALGGAHVLTVDSQGNITTIFNGQSYSSSFIDSGSNGIYFLDAATSGLPLCPDTSDFYCPPTTRSLSATNRGLNGTTTAVTFNAGNVDQLDGRLSAFSEVTGPNAGLFDWGLGFFYGKTIFTAFESTSTPGGNGPYVAY